MGDIGEGTWVRAARDFGYDTTVGAVKRGQVFQLGGHRNDEALLRHAFFTVLEPQPKASALDKLPQCGTCGRQFTEEWERDLCGEAHEMDALTSATEKKAYRRQKAHERVEQAQQADAGERVITIGK